MAYSLLGKIVYYIITEVPICMLWWLREGHFELEFHVGHQSLHIAWLD